MQSRHLSSEAQSSKQDRASARGISARLQASSLLQPVFSSAPLGCFAHRELAFVSMARTMRRMKSIQVTISKGRRYYIAECLDLPVVTQGKTLTELTKNLKEALTLHLEGEVKEMPAPKELRKLLKEGALRHAARDLPLAESLNIQTFDGH
jgi:predicted RNase H-like HicB family nuclease